MPQEIYTHTFPNGLTLLAERMPHVRSVAFNFMVPAGSVNDPPTRFGTTSVLSDMITRGAGTRDSRELTSALDNLGVDRSETAGIINMHFSAVLLARNLHPTLEIYADIIRRPMFPEEELEASQSLALQDIQALDDEPQARVMVELAKHYYPEPLGRDRRGTIEGVRNITMDSLREQHTQLFHAGGAILAVAGDIQWEALKALVERLFGDWAGRERAPLLIGEWNRSSENIAKDLEQTQITLAYPSVPRSHPDFYEARGAVGVLSQDMSSRLFMNVREKHGLCYSVYASYEAFPDRATIVCYAGARPELAQQTLDLTVQELRRLREGIEEEELDRVKVGLKSSLIMRQESTNARAGSLTADWYYLGRIVPLDEVQSKINGLTTKGIIEHVERFPANELTVVTLGPKPLEFPT